MWTTFVDLFRGTIFSAAHVCGGSLGTGLLVVSFVVRLALMPLTLRLARRAMVQQRKLGALQPRLKQLNKRFAKDPARLLAATQALHREHDVQLFDSRSVAGSLVQLPFLGALFTAVRSGLGVGVRYLWIGDLARPDRALVVIVGGLSAGVAALTPGLSASQQPSPVLYAVIGVAAIIFLWSSSSAVALSWGAGSAVSALQNVLLRRELARARSPRV
jgi:YidC/Oxa1 family membrane protein insertase